MSFCSYDDWIRLFCLFSLDKKLHLSNEHTEPRKIENDLRNLYDIKNKLKSDIHEIDDELLAVNQTISRIRDKRIPSYEHILGENVNESNEMFQNSIKFYEILQNQLSDYRKFRAEKKLEIF